MGNAASDVAVDWKVAAMDLSLLDHAFSEPAIEQV